MGGGGRAPRGRDQPVPVLGRHESCVTLVPGGKCFLKLKRRFPLLTVKQVVSRLVRSAQSLPHTSLRGGLEGCGAGRAAWPPGPGSRSGGPPPRPQASRAPGNAEASQGSRRGSCWNPQRSSLQRPPPSCFGAQAGEDLWGGGLPQPPALS